MTTHSPNPFGAPAMTFIRVICGHCCVPLPDKPCAADDGCAGQTSHGICPPCFARLEAPDMVRRVEAMDAVEMTLFSLVELPQWPDELVAVGVRGIIAQAQARRAYLTGVPRDADLGRVVQLV